jgi:DNA-binding MurR/RpiR family transcriptional regulator
MKYQFNIIHTLNKMLGDLPKAEKIVAKYIVENRELIPNQNIQELSEQSGGTPSAITRLCKRLEVKGYSQLRLQIMSELSRNTIQDSIVDNVQIKPAMEITHSIIGMTKKTLCELESIIDINRIREAAVTLANARKIDIYGSGASSLTACDLHNKFLRIGLNSNYNMSEYQQLTSACNLVRRDAVIAISLSGESESVIKAASIAAEQKACVISITSNVSNRLAEIAEIPLYIPVSKQFFRFEEMSSRIAQLCLADILYYYTTQEDPEETMNRLMRTDNVTKS